MQYFTQPTNGLVNMPSMPNVPYQPQSVTPVQQPQNTFAWIQGGVATATNYPVAPGNTVVLIDSDNPLLFIKSADLSGKPQPMQTRYLVTEEDYNKLQNGKVSRSNDEQYVTKEYFEKKLSELDNKFVAKRRDK